MKISFWCRFFSGCDWGRGLLSPLENEKGGKIMLLDEICFSTYSADSEKLSFGGEKDENCGWHIWHFLIIMWRYRCCVYLERSREKKHRIMCLTLSWYAIGEDVAANPHPLNPKLCGRENIYFMLLCLHYQEQKKIFEIISADFERDESISKEKYERRAGWLYSRCLPQIFADPSFAFVDWKRKKVCFSGYVVLSTILSWNVKLLEGFSSSFPFSRSPLNPAAEERNYFPAWFHFKWFLGCFCRKKKTIFTSLMKKFSLSWFIWEVCSLLMFSLPWSEIV